GSCDTRNPGQSAVSSIPFGACSTGVPIALQFLLFGNLRNAADATGKVKVFQLLVKTDTGDAIFDGVCKTRNASAVWGSHT
ncbi:MAG: hypothetical protein ACKOU7_00695, partial [Ferruginibacter sp.]